MKLINLLKKANNIILIGRGPSSRFFIKKNKFDFVIGFNFEKNDLINFDAIFFKNKIVSTQFKKDFIKLNKIYNYKIGSVSFSLFNLLFFFNSLFKKKNILLYGFDFKKYSSDDDILKQKRIKNDSDNIQENIDINSQMFAFNTYRNSFKNLVIKKFGFDFYSDFKSINNPNSLEIIAECTTNHHGNTFKLEKLLKECVNAKCKVIKFQKRDVVNFYDKKTLEKTYITPLSKNFYEYRKKLEFTKEQLDLVYNFSRKHDLKVIFSALDVKSYLELKNMKFKYFKIPSTISEHKKFINYMSKENNKLTYISTGMTDQKYVNYILNKFKNKNIVLMHAISAYPTKFENINFNVIAEYKKLADKNNKIKIGYSSHDVGELGSMIAIAAGAKVIEKHVKIGNTPWMHFDDTAIDAKLELPIFIENLKKINVSMGSKNKKIYNFEHHKYKV